MKRNPVFPALFAAVILLATIQTQAQDTVNPGEPTRFNGPTSVDHGTSSGTFGSHGYKPPYEVLASAGVIGVANMKVTAFSETYNDFTLSGNVPRVLSAQISARAEWNGQLVAGGVLGTKAIVALTLTLTDLTTNSEIQSVEMHKNSIGGSVGSADSDDDKGNTTSGMQVNLIRGHRYRLAFRLDCEAKSGTVAGSSSCIFYPDPIFPGYAKLTNLSILVSGDVYELLDTIDNKVDELGRRLTVLQDSVNVANNNINVVNGKVDAVNNKLDARLDVAVSTRASQTSVNILTGKVDDLAAALEAFKKQSLRAEIEAALVEGDRYNVVWFQTPESASGYLELVRSIVAESIASCRKAGLPAAALVKAEGAMASGDAYLTAKGYKDAYDQYRAAYLQLSIVPGNHRP